MSRATLKAASLLYMAAGWSGWIPDACQNTLIVVPTNIGPLLWGWPHRFQERMARVGTQIFAVGPYWGGEYSTGIDDEANLRRLPGDYRGGISTDRIYDLEIRGERTVRLTKWR